jgi:hypothetical protein
VTRRRRTATLAHVPSGILDSFTSLLDPFSPKVWWDGDRLCTRTSLFWQVLALGSWCQRVVVDPRARRVFIAQRRLFSLLRERAVDFDEISHIEYRYAGFSLSPGANSSDSFSIALALYGGAEIDLFSFWGEGSAHIPVSYIAVGDARLDFTSGADRRSRSYLDALMAATGKGLSKRGALRR